MSCLVKAAAFTTIPSFGSFRWNLLRFHMDSFYRRRRTVAKGFGYIVFIEIDVKRQARNSLVQRRGCVRRNVCNLPSSFLRLSNDNDIDIEMFLSRKLLLQNEYVGSCTNLLAVSYCSYLNDLTQARL